MMQKGQKKQQQMQGRIKTTTKTAIVIPTTVPTLEFFFTINLTFYCLIVSA
jgi:hypothetical protein